MKVPQTIGVYMGLAISSKEALSRIDDTGSTIGVDVRDYFEEAVVLAEEYVKTCAKCMLCAAGCTSYQALRSPKYSPPSRLRAAYNVLVKNAASKDDIEALYTCSLCGACTAICPLGIETWRVVHAARMKLSLANKQPQSLQQVAENILRSGHSFTPSPDQVAKTLTSKARELGVKVDEPAEALYAPSPFDTTFYVNVLENSLLALKKLGVDVAVSTRVLDLGGNAAIDAARPDTGLRALVAAIEEAEKLGARTIILSGCGADTKLIHFVKALGARLPVRPVSLYSLAEKKLVENNAARPLAAVTLFPSCGFARFAANEYKEMKKCMETACPLREVRDKPPYTRCCGGGGGVNYLREPGLAELKKQIYVWRISQITRNGSDKIVTPCIKCYTVFRHAALLAKQYGKISIEHMSSLYTKILTPRNK
jgi:Fe-S oxidoreductase